MAYEAYRKRTEIPRGLDYLADRLVRAVIRVQPKNVHEFAAQFFDGLLRQRDPRKRMLILLVCCTPRKNYRMVVEYIIRFRTARCIVIMD